MCASKNMLTLLFLLHSQSEKMDTPTAAKISSAHWSQGLYASMNDKSLLIYKDDKICIIKDKYPKSKNHFLVMPMEKLTTLNDMSSKHIPLVEDMIAKAQEKLIETNPDDNFKMGFHAIPSMAQVNYLNNDRGLVGLLSRGVR